MRIEIIEETLTDGSKVYNIHVKGPGIGGTIIIGEPTWSHATKMVDVLMDASYIEVRE